MPSPSSEVSGFGRSYSPIGVPFGATTEISFLFAALAALLALAAAGLSLGWRPRIL